MATKAGSIYTEIRARLDKYERDLAKAQVVTNRSAGKIQKRINKISFRKASQSMAKFSSNFMKLQGLFAVGFAGFGIGKIAGSFLEVAESFEQMAAKLDILTQGRGTEKLNEINQWALSLPISTKEVTQAFVRMTAMGLNPTMDRMKALANVASVMGDDILPRLSLQLGQAAAKGKIMQQDINIMGEAGIDVAKHLREAFGMTVTELASSGIDIQVQLQAVFDGMAKDFDGSIERMSKTWRGLKAITASYFVEIQRKVMAAGAFDALKDRLEEINKQMGMWIESNSVFLSQDFPDAVMKIAEAVGNLTVALAKTITMLTDDTLWKAIKAASGSAKPWIDLYDQLQKKELEFWDDRAANRFRAKVPARPVIIRKKIPLAKKGGVDPVAAAKAAAELDKQYIALLSTTRTLRDSWEVKGERTFTDEQLDKADQLKNAFDSLEAKRINEDLEEAFKGIDDKAETSFNSLAELSERTAWAMQENFSNVFFDAMKGELNSFKDYAMSIFDSITRAISDMAGQAVAQGLFGKEFGGGGLLSLLSSRGGSGAIASAPAGVQTIRGGAGGGYGFDSGGFIGEGVMGVGKKSGSSYEFHPNEVVLPAGKMGGGVKVDVNVTNNLGQEAQVQQTSNWVSPDRMVADIVLNKKLTSRGFRQGIRG